MTGLGADVLEEIRAADRHEGGIRCLRLLRVDPDTFAPLHAQVTDVCRTGRPSVVTDPGHVTSWVMPYGTVLQFSLLNVSGRLDDFSSDHDLDRTGKRLHDAAQYPAIADFLAFFPTAINLRINVLGPRSGLSPHEEHVFARQPDGSVVARIRLHLPIETTREAELILDGDVHHLEPGIVHLVNHGCVHAAANPAGVARIHLVWDVLLDAAAYGLLFEESSPVPAPFTRLTGSDRVSEPVRHERMAAPRRLPAPVSRSEADAFRLG